MAERASQLEHRMQGQLFTSADDSPSLRRLETVVRSLFTAFALINLVPLVTHTAAASWPWGYTVPLSLTGTSVVLVLLRSAPFLPLTLMLLALAVAIPFAPAMPPSFPRILLGILAFVVVLHYRRRRVIRLYAWIVTTYVIESALLGAPGLWKPALDDAVLSSALVLTGANLFAVLVGNVLALDRVRQERIAFEMGSSLDSVNLAAVARTRQLLHDEVIGTLTAISDYRGSAPFELVDACRRVEELLDQDRELALPKERDLTELVSESAHGIGLRIHRGETVSQVLSADQASAVSRALREALRNVRRHAQVEEVTINWWREGKQCHLQVSDSGRGAQHVASRWGLRNSIEDPLVEIGGRVDVVTSPGQGLCLTMIWPISTALRRESRLERSHRETARAIAGDQSLAMRIAVTVVAGNLWLAGRYSWGDDQAVAEIFLAVGISLLTLAAVNRVRRLPPSPLFLMVVAVGSGIGSWTGLELAGPASLVDYSSWCIGLSVIGITVIAFYLPLGWALLLLFPISVSVVAHVLLSGTGLAESGGALNAAVLPGVLGQLFGAYLRWARRTMDDEEGRMQRAATEALGSRVHRSVAASQLTHARRVLVPWLRELAQGSRSIDDPQTQTEARALSVEMRDELHFPGVLDAALRNRIARARATGTEVILIPLTGEPIETGPYLDCWIAPWIPVRVASASLYSYLPRTNRVATWPFCLVSGTRNWRPSCGRWTAQSTKSSTTHSRRLSPSEVHQLPDALVVAHLL